MLREVKIDYLLMRHEQAAAHAADGYARTTGEPGVCLATSGLGATNLATGLATAYMDSRPLVAITGQVDSDLLGRDGFQEIDTTGMSLSITKHNFVVREVENLASNVKRSLSYRHHGTPRLGAGRFAKRFNQSERGIFIP